MNMPSPHKNLRQNRESRFRASTGVRYCLTRQFFYLPAAGRQRHYILSHLRKLFLMEERRLTVNPKCFRIQLMPYLYRSGLLFASGLLHADLSTFPKRYTMISTNKKLLILHRTQQETIAAPSRYTSLGPPHGMCHYSVDSSDTSLDIQLKAQLFINRT